MYLFSHILDDNLSGSGSILYKVQSELIKAGEDQEVLDSDELLQQTEKLKRHFPLFGLLWHFLNDLKNVIKPEMKIDGRHLSDFVKEYRKKWNGAQEKACHHILKSIDFKGKKVLVHSNSSAIHTLFALLHKRHILPVVWQTYSSPAGEGKMQAKTLSNIGFETHLVHEDTLSHFIGQMDMAIFGTDMLLEDRFVNKVGTFPIALLFDYFKKPIYVLAEQRKIFLPQDMPELSIEEEKPVTELIPGKTRNLRVHNLYFESVPISLVNRVFLDE